ncbi:hypothetical protein FA15DRAFT_352987 [Coprinopsis marcescibilis]|uniref:Uncharacterized protein n=1 Tax=Coprinopsis marcescibilis TaxID=230819 RepID=A0A5C3KY92_COPMA|nr:hypothetical protein FA15DRAFT_352987 [Coprinopsis marcescibilis]
MINALKNPSFFRPMSRPSSPAPTATPMHVDAVMSADKPANPLNKLSLNNFRRPAPVASPAPPAVVPSLVQDGTYLEMLSLKFSEAVSKALAQPVGPVTPGDLLAGKRPLPAGRGSALGTAISSELNAARENPHLYRAILRCLHRPLSVLVTNLSSILLPLLASPAFLTPSAPTPQNPNPNPTQVHALGIAKLAEELLDVFDKLELGTDSDPRGDGLKSLREGLASLITKITTPLIAGIRNELVSLVEALESAPKTTTPAAKSTISQHPSIVTLQTVMPLYARALNRYTSSGISQATLANVLISVLWKGMVALSHRQDAIPPPPSPVTTGGLAPPKKRRGSPPSTTPPTTPPASRFTLKLPPSRPPSPPGVSGGATAASDCRALFNLVILLPRPSVDKPSAKIAREAVDEAFEGLQALAAYLEGLQAKTSGKDVATIVSELQALTNEIPTLIALPPLLRMYGPREGLTVASILGLPEEEYRRGILTGFGRAEECADAVGHRVLRHLQTTPGTNDVVLEWLNLELINE